MKEKLSIIYKILIVIVSGIGLYLNFKLIGINGFAYFTVQSNLLVFIYYLILLFELIFDKHINIDLHYFYKSIITMAVTFAMIGYFLMYLKNGTAQVYVGHEIVSIFLHVFTPLLVIIDYFIYDEKGYIKRVYPLIWSLLLVAYIFFDIIFTSLGGVYSNGKSYPYIFLNNNKYGNLGVMINCIIIYVLCIVFGIIIQHMDKKVLSKKERQR